MVSSSIYKESHMYVSEKYLGQGHYTNRVAVIQENGDVYFVDLYLEDIMIKTVNLTGKSIHYARDTAENWITGVIPA
jgi:hypothetical protein